jgi:uncharacterized OB-fold protein
MTADYQKPLPVLNKDNRPFWEGCKAHRLLMQQCGECGHVRFPINTVCPRCLSPTFDWKHLSGRGSVFSYVVFHQVYNKAFAADAPYNVALVQLDEGPRMYSNVVGVANDQVKVGDRLEVVFDDVTDEVSIPRFQLAGR